MVAAAEGEHMEMEQRMNPTDYLEIIDVIIVKVLIAIHILIYGTLAVLVRIFLGTGDIILHIWDFLAFTRRSENHEAGLFYPASPDRMDDDLQAYLEIPALPPELPDPLMLSEEEQPNRGHDRLHFRPHPLAAGHPLLFRTRRLRRWPIEETKSIEREKEPAIRLVRRPDWSRRAEQAASFDMNHPERSDEDDNVMEASPSASTDADQRHPPPVETVTMPAHPQAKSSHEATEATTSDVNQNLASPLPFVSALDLKRQLPESSEVSSSSRKKCRTSISSKDEKAPIRKAASKSASSVSNPGEESLQKPETSSSSDSSLTSTSSTAFYGDEEELEGDDDEEEEDQDLDVEGDPKVSLPQKEEDLPQAYRDKFNTIGFAIWRKKSLPCMIISPFDFDENSETRKLWFTMARRHLKRFKSLEIGEMQYVVYWYSDITYSLVPADKFVKYEDAPEEIKTIPGKIMKKIEDGEDLTKKEKFIFDGLELQREELVKPKDRRLHYQKLYLMKVPI
jgi:hypothetical protein